MTAPSRRAWSPGGLIACLAALWLGVARPAAAQDIHLLVITGVGGDDEHTARFHKWAVTVVDSAKRRGVSDVVYLSEKPELDPARIQGRSTKENVTKAFNDLASRARGSDEIFVILLLLLGLIAAEWGLRRKRGLA